MVLSIAVKLPQLGSDYPVVVLMYLLIIGKVGQLGPERNLARRTLTSFQIAHHYHDLLNLFSPHRSTQRMKRIAGNGCRTAQPTLLVPVRPHTTEGEQLRVKALSGYI